MEFTKELRALLAQQDQLVTRRQLLDLGVSKSAIRHHAGGDWRVVLPCVYKVGSEVATDRQRLIAGLLHAGPQAALAGTSAIRWHGVSAGATDRLVRIVVPPPVRARRTGFVVIRRSQLLDKDVRTIGPIRVSSPARAAVDAAVESRGRGQREAILIEVVQKGLATVDELTEWVSRLRTRDAAALWPGLAAAADGAWSVPEMRLLDLVATSEVLPEPMLNPVLHGPDGVVLTSPDLWWDDVAMAAMVHSKQWHSTGEDWDVTVERDADLVCRSVIVAGVTPRRIGEDPRAVLARLEASYRAAQGRPRPDVVATPRLHVRVA